MRRIKNTMQYFAFFQKNENGGYTVTVPSLPGLVTEGRMFDEANIMLRDAIRCYKTGLKKTKEKITRNMKAGSFLVALPA
jgi:predicted RNase H-like HicB family nuclease